MLRAHRVPGMCDDVPTTTQVLRMATSGGAKTTPYGESIGTLEAGRLADMVLIDWQQVAYPYLDEEMPCHCSTRCCSGRKHKACAW